MYPGVTYLDALLAFVLAGVFELDLVCVSAVRTESFHEVFSFQAARLMRLLENPQCGKQQRPQGLGAQEILIFLRGPGGPLFHNDARPPGVSPQPVKRCLAEAFIS
jgi:hypothetical protein